ncbi:MAG: prepilin-type N-terminal cleavage/methylation domain-containing protein [Deltaproteobacteria bacterium]|jgi:prepilin-type N-terminal cleavage/methylation domain-containing protein|nr:prepilin-type N-terminal cleavage/methylation domain-containing protein [Deltaproteobacteria bacterium]
MGRNRKNNVLQGFTLIELLVSVFILTIGCLTVISSYVNSLKAKNVADNSHVAAIIAVTEMERLKSVPFDALLNMTNVTTSNLNRLSQTCSGPAGSCGEGYIFTRTVRFFPRTPTSLSCHVEIQVDWRDSSGPRLVRISSILSSTAFS